jgi:ATP-dependent RNA helicase RhlE
MSFAELDLCQELMQAVQDCGYTEATPVQTQVIPVILSGRDVMAGAQTGTGKTAAFALPILQLLKPHANTSFSPARHPVRALILTPTRELAIQVEDSVKTYGKHLPLRSTVVYGGVDIGTQIPILRSGVEILVATPGRLLDHLHNKTVSLSQVSFLVLDEADRMLDMGFMPDIKRIIATLPVQRQNLMFSATYSDEIRRLAESVLRDPAKVEAEQRNTAAETVEQVVHPVPRERKRSALAKIIRARNLEQVLVFTTTKISANRLVNQLNRDGLSAGVIHGDKTQTERLQALEGFKEGRVGVLVATDVAARGLDIEALPCVVNYELPHNAEDYIHRIGRTGRAGASGLAISLVAEEELRQLADIERLLKRKLPSEVISDDAPRHGRDSERRHEQEARSALFAAAESEPVIRPSRSRRQEIPALFRPPVESS